MIFHIQFSWMYFSIAFGAVLILTFIMSLQARNFYTNYNTIKKFSILDLQFPASAIELATYIKGIFLLPANSSAKVLRSLKSQLYTDFLFMIAAYGTVFILCMKVSMKMTSFGQGLFAVLAWIQILPFIFDVIENIYLLGKIKPEPPVSKPSVHKTMEILVFSKWIIALTATVCSVAAICYFWLVGRFTYNSLEYLVLIISELALFFIVKKATHTDDKEKLAEISQ